jgi:YfiH family protein
MEAGVERIVGWERFGWLCAGFSQRVGGGTSVYGAVGEQNLGWTAEDDPAVVTANRRGLVEEVGAGPEFELVTVRQVHGAVVHPVKRGAGLLSTPAGRAVLQGDGLVTSEAGLMLGVQTADCVPVLIADTRTRAVGAFHAGWRGTVARIVEEGVATMAREFGSKPEEMIAAVGPSIGPCCFEVGEEVRAEFEHAFPYAQELLRQAEGAKPAVDLWEANRRQLLAAGLRPAAITVLKECTVCSRTPQGRRKYFSHRAERGITGRMLNIIGVRHSG